MHIRSSRTCAVVDILFLAVSLDAHAQQVTRRVWLVSDGYTPWLHIVWVSNLRPFGMSYLT